MKRTLVMHPRTEQLLSIRDGVCDAKWQNHLRECAQCAEHLEALERTRTRLRELPMIEPPVAWRDVQARMNAASSGLRSTRGTSRMANRLIGFAAAASVAIVALLVGTMRDRGVVTAEREHAAVADRGVPSHSASTTVELASLIERSRRLDALLQAMPARPHVERVNMAATLDTMEGRIQWLDYQLAYGGSDLDASQSERLWRERVELMDSLVKVRYAQAGTML